MGAVGLLDSFVRFALQGLGTPAPVFPTLHLVVTGLYRYVRNPMYVAVVMAILGQGLILGNVTLLEYGGLVWLLFVWRSHPENVRVPGKAPRSSPRLTHSSLRALRGGVPCGSDELLPPGPPHVLRPSAQRLKRQPNLHLQPAVIGCLIEPFAVG
ncbi:MAG: hypothetical protein LAQ69_39345 [Acidobacteriia bacterium]|nr:hypothetical protein [Terriglobia bacterium]